MNRSEFIESITTWDDLLTFCRDYEVAACEDIYMDSYLDDAIEEDVSNRDCTWYELRDELDSIDLGEVFIRRGWMDYVCVDGEFERYKQDVLSECDDWEGFWDEEEEEEQESPDEDDWFGLFTDDVPEEEPEQEEELPDFSVLLSICESSVRIISQ